MKRFELNKYSEKLLLHAQNLATANDQWGHADWASTRAEKRFTPQPALVSEIDGWGQSTRGPLDSGERKETDRWG